MQGSLTVGAVGFARGQYSHNYDRRVALTCDIRQATSLRLKPCRSVLPISMLWRWLFCAIFFTVLLHCSTCVHASMRRATSSGYSRWGACPQAGKVCIVESGISLAKRAAKVGSIMRSCWPHRISVGQEISVKRRWKLAISGGTILSAER